VRYDFLKKKISSKKIAIFFWEFAFFKIIFLKIFFLFLILDPISNLIFLFILKFEIWNFDFFFKKSYLSLSTDYTYNFLVNR
jgi:hypothetical protein